MALMFIDFPTGRGSQPYALLQICEDQGHSQVNWNNSNLVSNIKYNGRVYLRMLSNVFLHGPPM